MDPGEKVSNNNDGAVADTRAQVQKLIVKKETTNVGDTRDIKNVAKKEILLIHVIVKKVKKEILLIHVIVEGQRKRYYRYT